MTHNEAKFGWASGSWAAFCRRPAGGMVPPMNRQAGSQSKGTRDYGPLSIAKQCNCGLELFADRKPPVGRQLFQGLPFNVGGPKRRKIYAGFGPSIKGKSPERIVIPIRRRAYNVIVAHTLIETAACEGEPVGRTVAEYVFTLADGSEHRAAIRERFEVGWFPLGWGHYPFASLPDQKDYKLDRFVGRWEETGRRQQEADQGWPRGYYLWNWRNPRPRQRIESLTVLPTPATFIVAAITTGHVDEFPFTREAGRDVKITLTRKADAQKPSTLEVEVDRGQATYVQALPAGNVKKFLEDDFKGWGQLQNPGASPAYCRVAAIPSATLTVRQDGKVLGRANWGQLRKRGRAAASEAVRLEVVDRGRNWVHTTVLDDETGRPVPCRIHFRTPEGVPYAPHGHHAHVNGNMGTWHIDVGGDVRLGQMSYAYIDGRCQGWLPRGDVIVDVARGYEYEPIRRRVRIEPGQRELTLRLKRWVHMKQQRYFSGDTHVHFLSTQGSHLEGQGEDVNVVNLLASQWGSLFTNTEEFTGSPSVSPDGWNIVYATQENRQHMLGHLTLLGLTEPVMPWCTGGPAEAEMTGALDTTMSDWADRCHAQGGTVVIPHLPTPNCEPATLIATGRADAVEILQHNPYNFIEYYRYLNCGYRLPYVGGTDKMTADVPVGVYRTYCYIPPDEPFTYESWCKALRGGNTFVSGGPMIRLTVEGRPIGSMIEMPGNGGTVEVEAAAESIFPIHTLQIVQQGRVAASTDDAAGSRSLRLKASIRVEENTWLAARCGGSGFTARPHHDGWRRGVMAHTSPVYVAVGGAYDLFSQPDAQYMLTLIEGGLSYVRDLAVLRRDDETTHHHGHAHHQAFLEEPFLQARAALHRRMHELGIPH